MTNMFRNLAFAAACSLAVVAPMAANAATTQLSIDGGAYTSYTSGTVLNFNAGSTYYFATAFASGGEGAGWVDLSFTLASSPPASQGAISSEVWLPLSGTLTNGTAQWYLDGVAQGVAQSLTTTAQYLSTTFYYGHTSSLRIAWDSASNSQVTANVAAVPVPAAGFLLLGGLGALGMAKKRRRKAA